MSRARVTGRAEVRRLLLETFTDEGRDAIREANRENAEAFADLARRDLPRGDERNGHLADTVDVVEGGGSETEMLTTVGDDDRPYPLHLDAGHRAPDGTHVEAVPFWNVNVRRMAGRASRRNRGALKKALKAISR